MVFRTIGIDPGTGSWDLLGLDDAGEQHREQVFLDVSIPTKKVMEDPSIILSLIEKNQPLDEVVAPSGHGIPLKPIAEITDDDILTANLRKAKDEPVMGVGRILQVMRDAGITGHVIPGVKQLGSVKEYLKYNKIDMGTADKVCVAAAGIVDQAKELSLPFEETGFILVEVGIGFNATLAVEHGQIIDGIGGTLGGMGFTAPGKLDAELAYLLEHISKKVIYNGGLATISGHDGLSPKEIFLMAKKDPRIADAVRGFFSDMVKGVVSLFPSFTSMDQCREILVSGRSANTVLDNLVPLLPPPLAIPARLINPVARISKIAAQGAAFIANGLAGGQYASLVSTMDLADSDRDLLADIFIGRVNLHN